MKAATVARSARFDPARLIEQHQAGVWRYLRVLGCEPTLADDLTQETFLAVLKSSFQDISPTATSSYLRRTAHNLFVSHQRRSGKVTSTEDIEHLDRTWTRWAGADNGDEVLDALRECLQGLNERARRALELRYRDEQSRATIAADLRLTEDGAKNLLQRAKHQLRDCIDGKLQ